MRFDPQKHHRHSIRLPNYDYTQPGGYCVTIVTYHRALLFGEIVNEEMILNDVGNIVDRCWRAVPEHFPNVELGAFVVMPNHIHGIIIIGDGRGKIYRPLPRNNFKNVAGSIPTIIRTFKSAVTRHMGREHNTTGI